MIMADILPLLFVILIVLILGVVSFLIFPMLYFKNIKKQRKIVATVVATVLMLIYIYAILGFASIAGFFSAVTGGGDKYAKPVNVLREPFNIYISGLDVSGKIGKKSRSDVNMIMTVNPKTNKILLTSIPRDLLVQMPVKGTTVSDKLTHSGIYGIGTTLGAAENLTGLDMNYYVKVNYTTVEKFVDAIGGIDVNSNYDFDTHGMKAKFHFNKGKNHLNGERALAFARERKSFPDGDFQRNRNQAKVMQAMLRKGASSKTILVRYSSILNSCKDYMRLNMTDDEIKRLIKRQISKGDDWSVKRQSIKGTPGSAQCYSTGSLYVSIVQADSTSLANCVARMKKVMGKE
jgi:LCP family protein required for cell wall assembly